MRNADAAETCLYLRAVRTRDAAFLVWLVVKRFPDVAWGAATNLLPNVDIRWALDAVSRPLQDRIIRPTETSSF